MTGTKSRLTSLGNCLMAAVILGAAVLSGCTTSPNRLYADPASVDDATLCRTFDTTQDPEFKANVEEVLVRRGLSETRCGVIEAVHRKDVRGGVINDVLAVGIIPICADGSCTTKVAPHPEWDRVKDTYDDHSHWRCRDYVSGQYLPDAACARSEKVDHFTGR